MEPQKRAAIGVRTGRSGPVLWCDPSGLEVHPGQHVRIATERGEQIAHVAVGLTAVPSDVPVATVRILGLAVDELTEESIASPTTVDAVESPPHHLQSPIAHDRIATLINRLLAIRREDDSALADLSDALGNSDSDAPDPA